MHARRWATALALAVALGAPGLAAAQCTPSAAGATASAGNKPTTLTTRAGRYDWGASISLLRIGALRDPTLPGRTHEYRPDIRALDTQLTFQLFYHPSASPWRRVDESTLRSFQVMSLSAFVLMGINPERAAQSEIALGVGMGFLENFIVVGVGFDLYRGVPVRGGDGVPGSHTVGTGLLAPITSSEGEITLENLFFVIHLNLVPALRNLP